MVLNSIRCGIGSQQREFLIKPEIMSKRKMHAYETRRSVKNRLELKSVVGVRDANVNNIPKVRPNAADHGRNQSEISIGGQ